MSRRASTCALIVLAVAGCASAPNADSRPESGPTRPPIPIVVQGLVCATSEQLLDVAKRELDAFQDGTRRATEVDDATYAMKRWLREKGLAHAKVEFAMEPDEDSVARVVITGGGRSACDPGRASIEGNLAYPTARLLEFFEFREKGEDPGEPVVYRQRDVGTRISALESFYLSEGGLPRARGSTAGGMVRGRDAGGGHGAHRRGAALPRRASGNRAGRPFERGTRAARSGAQLRGEALLDRSSGRSSGGRAGAARPRRTAAHAGIREGCVVDDESGVVTVVLRVRTGPRVQVDDLTVHGNDRTDLEFILEQSELTPGAILTQNTLDRAIDGLYTTGLFKSVRMTKTPAAPHQDIAQTDIDIAVEELDARIVDFEAGYGSYEQLRGAVRYRDRNISSAGDAWWKWCRA